MWYNTHIASLGTPMPIGRCRVHKQMRKEFFRRGKWFSRWTLLFLLLRFCCLYSAYFWLPLF